MSIRRLGALVVLALVVAACSAGAGSGGQLEGTRWVLDSYSQGGSLAILPEIAVRGRAVRRLQGLWVCRMQRL